MKIIEFLRTRALDVVLVLIVFTLFFVSGTKPPESTTNLPLVNTEPPPIQVDQVSSVDQTSVPAVIPTPGRAIIETPPLPPQAPQGQIAPIPMITPNPNPYKSLQESFKQVEGGSISTEAIIERNTYFRKLSEQLRDMQGEVSTESNSLNNPTNNVNSNDANSHEVILPDSNDDPNEIITDEYSDIDALIEDEEL